MAKTKEKMLVDIPAKPSLYEMVVVFKPFLPDKVRNEADDKVAKIVEDADGKVAKKDIWGKRYLAYEIQGHIEGYYIMYHFEAPPAGMDAIKKYLNRHTEILRYLILKQDKSTKTSGAMKVKKTVEAEVSEE